MDTTPRVVVEDTVDISEGLVIIINDQSPKQVTITGRFDNKVLDATIYNKMLLLQLKTIIMGQLY